MQSDAVDWTSQTLDVVLTALKKKFTVADICTALSGTPEPPKNKVHLKPFLKVMETSLEVNAPPEPTGTPPGTLPTPEAQPMETYSLKEQHGGRRMWHDNIIAMVDLPQDRVSCGDSVERISCDASVASVGSGQVRSAEGGEAFSKLLGWHGGTPTQDRRTPTAAERHAGYRCMYNQTNQVLPNRNSRSRHIPAVVSAAAC
jgi:hypothetical protein